VRGEGTGTWRGRRTRREAALIIVREACMVAVPNIVYEMRYARMEENKRGRSRDEKEG